MAERIPEPTAPQTYYPPVEPDAALAARNVAFGATLFAIALLIAAGAVVISLVYLHFD